ncbi:MAG: hypothetical protein LBR39_07365 [Coriobacteriales bacterium]|jgi:hypothetical protein|nr:hypothetical protein [Coriobacteriales bacterium]
MSPFWSYFVYSTAPWPAIAVILLGAVLLGALTPFSQSYRHKITLAQRLYNSQATEKVSVTQARLLAALSIAVFLLAVAGILAYTVNAPDALLDPDGNKAYTRETEDLFTFLLLALPVSFVWMILQCLGSVRLKMKLIGILHDFMDAKGFYTVIGNSINGELHKYDYEAMRGYMEGIAD